MTEKWHSSVDDFKEKWEKQETEARLTSRKLIKADELQFERCSQRGLFIAPIIRNHLGFKTRVLAMDLVQIPPGGHSEPKRNPEAFMHVIKGQGYSIINGIKYEWERGDSLFIKPGYWHSHFNLDPQNPADFLWVSIDPFYQNICPMPTIPKGDSYSDPGEDYIPPHPFGFEQKPIQRYGDELWLSGHQLMERNDRKAEAERQEKSRTILKAKDIQLERSEHKGDFIMPMLHRWVGFNNKIIRVHLQQLPPMSHTETHRHDEAIVFVLKGKGHSINDGVRVDWSDGDCMHVQPNEWHQHWNDEENGVTQHLCMTIIPLREYAGDYHFEEYDRNGDFVDPGESYKPNIPWEK